MTNCDAIDRLRAGEVLLLDGATGSELQRRGVNVSRTASEGNVGAWSATANLEAPDVIRQVHEDYLRAGVDILTSNNFWTSEARLAPYGLGDRWQEYTRAAAQLALDTRDALRPQTCVAGGIAPPGDGSLSAERIPELERTFREQSRLLAELGVDLILAEYVGPGTEDCVGAVDACAETGLPVLLGVRHVTKDGKLQSGQSLEELGEALAGHPVSAILLMCAPPDDISASLPRLREAFDGPIGAYANIGYELNPSFGTPGQQIHRINQDLQVTYNPASYAEFAREWVSAGAQIVGGCCATRPEHIDALRPVVTGAPG